ncbi:MAG: exo-alpha-sialidase [Verrucomicrobiota bacterium]
MNVLRHPHLSLLIIILALLCGTTFASAQEAVLVETIKLWDKGNHNAFTDLVRFKSRWYCAFREAEAHVSPKADIRILSSKNGRDWESASVIEMRGHDLRDPKLTVSPDGKWLELLAGDTLREGNKPATLSHSFIARSHDGIAWSRIDYVAPEQEWLWRITWHKKKAYGVAYDVRPEIRALRQFTTRLYVSDDGVKFQPLADPLCDEIGSNEATIRFANDGTAYVLQRRDGPDKQTTAFLGTSHPPYKEWTWKDLGVFFGGPNFIQIPDGRWIAAGRMFRPDEAGNRVPRTVICELDVVQGALRPLLDLPSGGDTSYAGLQYYGNLWVSYYSSHEGKSSIYLSKVKLPKAKK